MEFANFNRPHSKLQAWWDERVPGKFPFVVKNARTVPMSAKDQVSMWEGCSARFENHGPGGSIKGEGRIWAFVTKEDAITFVSQYGGTITRIYL